MDGVGFAREFKQRQLQGGKREGVWPFEPDDQVVVTRWALGKVVLKQAEGFANESFASAADHGDPDAAADGEPKPRVIEFVWLD
jgi:hypothetical protein